jgi:hypothetical protein
MNRKYGYNSEVWWDDIAHYAKLFEEHVNNQKDKTNTVLLKIRGLERVRGTYGSNLYKFKKKVYGRGASKHRIDRHKIIALYIKSFLEVSPFYVENPKREERTEIQNCPNEYFSFQFMSLILMAWNESNSLINMDKQEKKWFIILLNYFRLNIALLDVLSLAQIIYYIEDKYIKKVTETVYST